MECLGSSGPDSYMSRSAALATQQMAKVDVYNAEWSGPNLKTTSPNSLPTQTVEIQALAARHRVLRFL